MGFELLELSFSTELMRNISLNQSDCYKAIGINNGQNYISLIADFRASMFAGEVPGGPTLVNQKSKGYELIWKFSDGCELVTSTTVSASINFDDWKQIYRIN